MTTTEWKCLQPEKLSINPNAATAEDKWKFWHKTFTNYNEAMPRGENALNKLNLLTAYLTAPVYKLICEETTYDDAITALENLFVKPKNEIYSRHKLATAYQSDSETVDEFVLRINKLCQECNFTAVNAHQYRDDMKRDSFICGISSNFIRERLLESRTLTFTAAYEKARALELARVNCEMYSRPQISPERVCVIGKETTEETIKQTTSSISSSKTRQTFECLKRKRSLNSVGQPFLASITALQLAFSKHVLVDITVNNINAKALIDTGSTSSYVSREFVENHKLYYKSMKFVANTANTSLQTEICGVCYLNLTFMKQNYNDFKFYVMSNLIADTIIGDDLLEKHRSVTFNFGGERSDLCVSASMPTANVSYPDLFANIAPGCKPIAVKTRKFSTADQTVIKTETSERLLCEDRIEKSKSPWRPQPLVVNNANGKRRMCIDYSQTINLFTALDAYPLPSIDSIINEVAKWKCISTLDLKSAYHQIKIRPEGLTLLSNLGQSCINGKYYHLD